MMAMRRETVHRRQHIKVHGFVDWIEPDGTWVGRIEVDGHEYNARMRDPLPKGIGQGHYFTIHTTKRGRTYLYWITKPLSSNRKRKEARAWARNAMKVLGGEGTDG